MDDDATDRRALRASWPGGLYKLGDEPTDGPLPADQALAALRELSMRAWLLTGQPLPTYNRKDMPCRLVRGYR